MWCFPSWYGNPLNNLSNAKPGKAERAWRAAASLRTTVIIWPRSGLFPSPRLSLLLQPWWNTAPASMKHLWGSACLIHSSPYDRPTIISLTPESVWLISLLPLARSLMSVLLLLFYKEHLYRTDAHRTISGWKSMFLPWEILQTQLPFRHLSLSPQFNDIQ